MAQPSTSRAACAGRKLNSDAQLQTFSHLTMSRLFLNSNGLMKIPLYKLYRSKAWWTKTNRKHHLFCPIAACESDHTILAMVIEEVRAIVRSSISPLVAWDILDEMYPRGKFP